MSYQPPPNRLRLEDTLGEKTTQKRRNKGRAEVTSVICVESNVSGRGGGAFSSTAEVWDGGWGAVRAVTAGGCPLRSLLKPILSVTAGGSGERRRPGRGDGEEINGAAGDHPLARHDAHTHTALSCSLYLSLTPSFPFISTLHRTVSVVLSRLSLSSLDGNTLRATSLICVAEICSRARMCGGLWGGGTWISWIITPELSLL